MISLVVLPKQRGSYENKDNEQEGFQEAQVKSSNHRKIQRERDTGQSGCPGQVSIL